MGYEWLSDYGKWREKSPQDVLDAVTLAGGWNRVFLEWKKKSPQQVFDIPRWAHKVRNFFNREPQGLTLLGKHQSRLALLNLDWRISKGPKGGIAAAFALSGDVYEDEYKVTWFQMGAGGTIFHFKNVSNMEVEAASQQYIGQAGTPVFKLVSPTDGTRGSRETIVRNIVPPRFGLRLTGAPIVGADVIGDEGRYEVVVSRIESIPVEWQGSYNYAETVVSGIELHNKFDIEPHEKDSIYVNPDNRFSDLSSRRFPSLIEAQKHW